MSIRTFILRASPHPSRELCKEEIDRSPDGYMIKIYQEARTLAQNEKMHAMIGDIAAQYVFCNRKWDAEDMKRLLIDQFKRDTINDPDFRELWAAMGVVDLAPALDGSGVVALGVQSRKFPKRLAIAFIEWLDAFGAQVGVRFSNPNERRAAA